MSRTRRSSAPLLLLLSAVLLASCGSSTQSAPPAAGRLEAVPGSPRGQIVLSAVGAQRIGIQTSIVRAARSLAQAAPVRAAAKSTTGHKPAPARARRPPQLVIPYSALVYAPDGQTYAFTNPSGLIYTEVPVDVNHIAGNSVYLSTGPRAGSHVVTVGAEELFGVQTGVLEQT